jgi:WD40 repeat protein
VGLKTSILDSKTSHYQPVTPTVELGPFYKRRAPGTNMLREPGDPGMPLVVAGQIFNMRGQAIPQAVVEVWPDSSLLAVNVDGTPVQLWNPAQGKLLAVLKTDFGGSTSRDFSPDSAWFATADGDPSVRIYGRRAH